MDANVERIARMQRIFDSQLDQMERDQNRPGWKNALIMAGQFAIGAGIVGFGALAAKYSSNSTSLCAHWLLQPWVLGK